MKTLKYLMIDDDLDEHEIFQMALVYIGEPFQHTSSFNGLEALNSLKSDNKYVPDFIFLDLNIPLVNGRECLEKIKRIESLLTSKVIIYSNSTDETNIREMQSLGATHYMKKPDGLEELVVNLSFLLQNKNLPFLLNKNQQ
jgi:DNA-binding response OmpR family regulator